jgi:hypothetical protein
MRITASGFPCAGVGVKWSRIYGGILLKVGGCSGVQCVIFTLLSLVSRKDKMTKKELLNDLLNHVIDSDNCLQQANDAADYLINNQVLDYHESSALSNRLYAAELAVNELILYLKSVTGRD